MARGGGEGETDDAKRESDGEHGVDGPEQEAAWGGIVFSDGRGACTQPGVQVPNAHPRPKHADTRARVCPAPPFDPRPTESN